MEITKEILKKMGCSNDGIIKFINTPELHNTENVKSITVTDEDIFTDFVFFLNRIKIHIVDSIKFENSFGSWKKYTYDDKGNEIKFETSSGRWEKYKYDSKGNKIKVETSIGRWEKNTYDSKGNKIEWEDSSGRWEKYKYDSKGNKIKVEDSSGRWEKYNYDMTKIKFIK